MRWYKADLHIHSVLSPCGDLSMSPQEVVDKACEQDLDIIAITDHNAVFNCPAYFEAGRSAGLTVLYGLEVQTAEEIHMVTIFDDHAKAEKFGRIVFDSLLPVANDPDYFGDQVVIDSQANIIRMEEKALINSSMMDLEEVVQKAVEFGALVFPAHVDADSFSIIGQLGLIPSGLQIDACGITAKGNLLEIQQKFPQLAEYPLLRNSDAHYPQDIGSGFSRFYIDGISVAELKLACAQKQGRKLYVK